MDALDLYIEEIEYYNGALSGIEQNIVFTVNGKYLPLVDPLDFLLSYKNKETINVDLFTCSCGVSGCAGWFDGVDIENKEHTVEWRVLDSNEQLQKTNVDRFYSFSKENYEDCCVKCIQALVDIEKKKLTVSEYNDSDEFGYRHNLLNSIEWMINKYKNNEIFDLLMNEYKKQIG